MFDRFWLLLLFGIISVLASEYNTDNDYGTPVRKWSCMLLCIIFVLQAGFRDWEHQFNDTINYARGYYALEDVSFDELLKSFSFVAEDYHGRDPGYGIFVKLTQLITVDFRFYLVLIATIISVPICRIIYKYSTSLAGVFIAAALYEALFAPFFETGIRQLIAMGFSFTALELFLKKKYVWFALLTVSAYTIHTSALIFLPLYLFLKYGNPKLILAACILMAPLFMYFSKEVMFYLGEDTIMSEYVDLETTDNKGTPVFSVMVAGAVAVTYFLANRIKVHYRYYRLMFLCMAFAIMLIPTTWVNSNFLRLELYYLAFLMPLMSVMVDAFTNNRPYLATKYYAILVFTLIVLSL